MIREWQQGLIHDAQANGARLVTVSRIAVAVWAVIMGCAMCVAQVAQINVNWLVLLIGALLVCSHPCCSWLRSQRCASLRPLFSEGI